MMRALPLTAAALIVTTAAGPLGAGLLNPTAQLRECIAVGHIRAESAETDVSLLFHGDGSRVFRNHLPAPCDRLMMINNIDTLKLRPNGGQLCRGDVVQVIDHGGPMGLIDGNDGKQTIDCKLGGFEPTTEMMVTEELRR
jgi:hypothetical protein